MLNKAPIYGCIYFSQISANFGWWYYQLSHEEEVNILFIYPSGGFQKIFTEDIVQGEYFFEMHHKGGDQNNEAILDSRGEYFYRQWRWGIVRFI